MALFYVLCKVIEILLLVREASILILQFSCKKKKTQQKQLLLHLP